MAKNLPSISSKLPQDVRNFLDRVAEFVRSSDGFLTRKQLKDAGIITDDQWGNIRDPLYDATVPPAPTNVQASGAIENIILTWDKAPYRNHAYAEVWGAETNVLGNAVLVGRTEASVFSHSIGAKSSRYYWVRFVSTGGVVGPYQGTTGVLGVTAYNPADLVTELAGLITESELATNLNSRIDLIDGPDTLNGSVNKRVLDEATARIAAVDAEATTRANQIVIESEARLRETQANADAILQQALGLDQEVLDRQGYITQARFDLTQDFQAGDYAEAQARLTLQAALEAADSTNAAAILSEQNARVTAVSAEATARDVLAAQIRGTYTGSDLNAITTGLLYQEKTARVNQDNALSQQITLLSAGSGEQFDWKAIWYFDSGVESWTGNGTPTASAGWLRPANQASSAYVISPVGIDALGPQYTQVRLRIRKTGAPTFAGYIWWRSSAESTWDVSRRVALSTPSYDVNGISVLSVDMPSGWTGTAGYIIDRIRIDLSSAQTSTDYFEIDWIAIGRPSPGASQAQLYELEYATVDLANNNSIAKKLDILNAQVNDPGGLAATVSTINNDYTVQADINSTTASAQQTLISNYTGSTNRVFMQTTAPVQSYSTVTLANGSQSAQIPAIKFGDIWYDTDDGMKPYTWNGAAWVYSPDTSAAASSAFAANWNSTMSSATGATASEWSTLRTQFYDPSTGLAATAAGVDTLSTSVAEAGAASAGETKTLYAKSQGSAERDLSQLLDSDAEQVRAKETLATIQNDLNVKIVDGLSAEATARTLLAATVNDNFALYAQELTTRASADEAIAASVTTLTATVNANQATVVSGYYTKADMDGAIANVYDAIQTVDDDSRALIQNVETTQIGYCTKGGKVFDGDGSIIYNSTTYPSATYPHYAADRTKIIDKVGVDIWNAAHPADLAVWVRGLPLATAVKQVHISDGTDTATIQDLMIARKDEVDGLRLEKVIKLDANGHVSGYGISQNVDGSTGTATSQFIASVDQFAVATPSSSLTLRQPSTAYVRGVSKSHAGSSSLMLVAVVGGTTAAGTLSVPDWTVGKWVNDGSVVWQIASRVPFSIFTNSQVVNGQTIPAGVYIDGAMVVTGTINNAQIGNGAIDDAKVAGLSAEKITAGNIDAARLSANVVQAVNISATLIDADQIDTRGLTVKDMAGNIILAAGTPLTASNITPDSGWLNSNVTASGIGAVKTDLTNAPSSILNSNISITENGTLSGGGGGAVTIGGLGYSGALDATKNVVSQGTLESRPTGQNGDFYYATDTYTLYQKISESWVVSGDITAQKTAAGITGQGAFATLSQITNANISTYIATAAIDTAYIKNAAIKTALIDNAAVGQAQIDLASVNKLVVGSANIADAAITTAKIGTAQVDTLQVAGNAITANTVHTASDIFLVRNTLTTIYSQSVPSSYGSGSWIATVYFSADCTIDNDVTGTVYLKLDGVTQATFPYGISVSGGTAFYTMPVALAYCGAGGGTLSVHVTSATTQGDSTGNSWARNIRVVWMGGKR